ncbi:MAG: aminotransferase class III-fold pyridoxal phosphate-dependent enzyme [Planctomycetes bacterium]|nr:aminotransferase class III-fold pyridoxal phosphate-dependent enzyme [Planctomycetota bacterium]
MSVVTENGLSTIEGYDLAAEKERYRFPDIAYFGKTLNRGTARVEIEGEMDPPEHEATREEHHRYIYTTTHDKGAPVLELGYATAGSYVACRAGVYLDVMLGCAQKILDEHHPRFLDVFDSLAQYGLLFRREINTDDYLLVPEGVRGVRTPQECARLYAEAAARAFPSAGPYRAFFSNSGAEAMEAAFKLAYQVKYKKFVARYGFAMLEKLLSHLGIPRDTALDGRTTEADPLYAEYPFALFGTVGAFHGRTLGALSLTKSKKAHRYGYPLSRWARHVAYNGDPKELENLIDPRPILEILAAEGGVARVFAQGRVPAELAAGFVAEPMQGEGGYVCGNPAWFQAVERICRRFDMMLIADEVQAFGRTGKVFCTEHLGVTPDVVGVAKSAVIGITLARAEYEKHLHRGWHSNTWGGGKLLDTNLSHATLDVLLHHEDPVFAGRGYLENSEIKGRYLRHLLGRLSEKHPDVLVGFGGFGLMNGITVRRRDDLVALGWKRGLKLLGCGAQCGETASIRLLFLADALAKEIEDFALTLDGLIQELKTSRT